jgi:hypothetical protein
MMDSCSKNGQLEDDETARSSTPATTVSSMASLQVITELRTNDVMMGRGAGRIHNMGNVRFRELVATRKEEYLRAERNHKKQTIAKQILAEIAHRNGRFVRKVEKPEEAKALGIPEGTQAWVLASSDAVLEKVKQALRDKGPHDAVDFQSTAPQDKTEECAVSAPSDAGNHPTANNGAAALALQNSLSAFYPMEEEHKHQMLLNQLQVRQHSLHLLRLGQLYQNSPPSVLDPSLYTLAQLSPAHSVGSSLHGGTSLNAAAQRSLNDLPALLVNERHNALLSAMALQPPVAVAATMSRSENPSEESSSKKRKL